jgi:hypothetical protein
MGEMSRVSEETKFLAEMLKDEVEAGLRCEARVTTLREDVIEIEANLGDDMFGYEMLGKLEEIAESYECDMEFYAGAEGNNLIILLYFYPER